MFGTLSRNNVDAMHDSSWSRRNTTAHHRHTHSGQSGYAICAVRVDAEVVRLTYNLGLKVVGRRQNVFDDPVRETVLIQEQVYRAGMQ